MKSYTSQEEYRQDLESRAELPEGFSAAVTSLTFEPRERPQTSSMKLALVLLDEPTSCFAGAFTRNRLAGAPVSIGRDRLAEPLVRGFLVNNKVANVAAPGGRQDALQLLERLAARVGSKPEQFFAASTGIIGWKLPVREMEEALPALVSGLQRRSLLPLAEAIMTTDRFPKLRSRPLGKGRLTGFAKGAGMIEPNLATMLVFLLTDAVVERELLREELSRCAVATFNRLTIDGDQSTSDMALLLASGRKGPVSRGELREALQGVCQELAGDIVRNGEGVGHVVRLAVSGAGGEEQACELGKAILNSPLVKTAIHGNDPNVGRILSALGDGASGSGWELDFNRIVLSLGGTEVFSSGAFRLDQDKEERLCRYLEERAFDPALKGYPRHEGVVEIRLELGGGGEAVELLGADLSEQYVRENADYRS